MVAVGWEEYAILLGITFLLMSVLKFQSVLVFLLVALVSTTTVFWREQTAFFYAGRQFICLCYRLWTSPGFPDMTSNLIYSSLKAASDSKDFEEKQRSLRHRNVMVLILQYLKDNGFFESAQTLLTESKAVHQDISGFMVCDNMDLSTVLLEYECAYFSRLQKKPKFVRDIPSEIIPQASSAAKKHPVPAKKTVAAKIPSAQKSCGDTALLPQIFTSKLEPKYDPGDRKNQDGRLVLSPPISRLGEALKSYAESTNLELRDLAEIISKEMYVDCPNVHWSDIKGMEQAKRFVQEAVVYPVKYPKLFKGILAPWRGLLLAGPPGTGKTMLAKAVATECGTAFFNITASTVVSKWRGESEKLVRVLFDLARKCAPSTIFLDELDSLVSQRGEGSEHEGSRRMKTEILIQMDGLQRSNDLVFVLAASNLPWELDTAMVRRLEKRVFVDLPCESARLAMFSSFLPVVFEDHPLRIRTELDYEALAEKTNGYSGSDIFLVCKEAAMCCVRKILAVLDADIEFPAEKNLATEPIRTGDVIVVLQYTRPADTVRNQSKYEKWKKELCLPV